MILFSHPTHNANVRQAALALDEAGLLQEFWTCIAWDPDFALNRTIPASMREQLDRRALPEALRKRARVCPLRELARHLCDRTGLTWLARHEQGIFSVDAVYRALDRRVAREVRKADGLLAVYCYEDGAAATFEAARQRGLRCIYDLPIGYWRAAHAIYEEEKDREPEWASTLSGMRDSPDKLARKDEELQAADLIVVASSFTRQTLQLAALQSKSVEVIPYGAPEHIGEPTNTRCGKRLRVLFVGALGQRKGLSYLLKAVEMLGSAVELTLLGRKAADTCVPLNDATGKHRWIPSLPHADVLEEMSRHDVLVFPSLFEGFGLVILEAMSRGIPVITTPNTAGPDIIDNGRDGFIIKIRSAEAIAEKLEELATDSSRLAAMKNAAYNAATSFIWKNYREKLVSAIRGTLPENGSSNGIERKKVEMRNLR